MQTITTDLKTNFGFPDSAARFEKIPKNIFFKKGLKLESKPKKYFIEQIKEINWAFALNQETINLTPVNQFAEIDIFVITLDNKEVPQNVITDILTAIDELIDYKIILFILKVEQAEEISYQAQMAYKFFSEAKHIYFKTDWQPTLCFDIQSLDLHHLTESLIRQVAMGILPNKPNQSLENSILQYIHIQNLQRKLQSFNNKRAKAKGLKERLALREKILELEREIKEITQ